MGSMNVLFVLVRLFDFFEFGFVWFVGWLFIFIVLRSGIKIKWNRRRKIKVLINLMVGVV